ncbi:MAG: C40 family peptidase [Bacteroidales bacterium]|nr:C40 family peptidase [Candidatus Sodaliphilus aphodohippi]
MKENRLHYILTATIIFVLAFTCLDANAQLLNSRKTGTIREQIENANIGKSRVQEILSFAHTFRGVPYRRGASSPRGFDCSGFTSYVFKNFGVKLNRTAHGQINDGTRIDRDELKPGDLVFFNGRARGKRIGHVGIVTEVNTDNTFKFIHAACHRGITVSNSTESYYQRRYMGACRVIE